ncbi:MAG: hypothetical protein V4505_25480 [Pseudomonadota bacterium]
MIVPPHLMELRACRSCGDDFSIHRARPTQYCSKTCARIADGPVARYPGIREIVELMFPHMSTRELATFLGMATKPLENYCHRRAIYKADDYMLACGMPHPWPNDPDLRELRCVRIALTRAINKRSKELPWVK